MRSFSGNKSSFFYCLIPSLSIYIIDYRCDTLGHSENPFSKKAKIIGIFFYCKSFGSNDLRRGKQVSILRSAVLTAYCEFIVQVGQCHRSEGGIFIIYDCRTQHLKLTGGGADIARKTNHKTGHLILKKFAV